MSLRPAHIVVVVPARDQEEHLPRCLAGLDAVRHRLGRCRVDPPWCGPWWCWIGVPTALSGSPSWPGVEVLTCDARRVGAARAAGITAMLQGIDPAAVGRPGSRPGP